MLKSRGLLVIFIFVLSLKNANAGICFLDFKYKSWKGSHRNSSEMFKNKQFFELKKLELSTHLGGFGEHTKNKTTKAPKELHGLIIKTSLEKDFDIKWKNHEEWKLELSLLNEKNPKMSIIRAKSSVIRSNKMKYEENESTPSLELEYTVEKFPLFIKLGCNDF